MAKYVYPAIFEPDYERGGFSVFFPDLANVFTEGNDFQHAMEMAEDALCLMLHDRERRGELIPPPSKTSAIETKADDIVNLVACDTRFYENYFANKSVKVNVTIPLWLKEEGEKRYVNFSQILQKGVKEYLQLR